MVDITAISSVAAAIGILIGVSLTIMQLRNLVIQRKVNTLIGLVPSFRPDGGEKMHRMARMLFASEFKDFDDFVQRYGDLDRSDSEVVNAFTQVSGWYESLGFLYYRKLVDRKMFCELFAYMPIKDWERLEPIILGLRKRDASSKPYEFFEFMVNDMKARLQGN